MRASSIDEIDDLVQFCRTGRLFDVQKWVEAGKPVALPEKAYSRYPKRNPLKIAMERGFHSLVEVLLEAGTPQTEGYYRALGDAVDMRRPDLAELLFAHGADVNSVEMRSVIEMWQPEMLELFLAQGAGLVAGNPIAWGLIQKIRPALGLIKKYGDDPKIMEQANIALRHHAREGNAKWVSLVRWAGADPWSKGPEAPDEEYDEEGGYFSALEWAAFRGHLEILQLKNMVPKRDPASAEAAALLEAACYAPNSETIAWLLDKGYSPAHLPGFGTGAISRLLNSMSWEIKTADYGWGRSKNGIDSTHTREQMKKLHMLVANGARWLPSGRETISDARRCLLKMAPQYTLEFLWLMKDYRAAKRKDVRDLVRTSAMQRLLSDERPTAEGLVAAVCESPDDCQ